MTKDQLSNELQVGDTVVIQMNSFNGPKFGEKYNVLYLKGDDIIVTKASEAGTIGKLSSIQACKVIKWKGE